MASHIIFLIASLDSSDVSKVWFVQVDKQQIFGGEGIGEGGEAVDVGASS